MAAVQWVVRGSKSNCRSSRSRGSQVIGPDPPNLPSFRVKAQALGARIWPEPLPGAGADAAKAGKAGCPGETEPFGRAPKEARATETGPPRPLPVPHGTPPSRLVAGKACQAHGFPDAKGRCLPTHAPRKLPIPTAVQRPLPWHRFRRRRRPHAPDHQAPTPEVVPGEVCLQTPGCLSPWTGGGPAHPPRLIFGFFLVNVPKAMLQTSVGPAAGAASPITGL